MATRGNFTIYSDDEHEGEWFRRLSPQLANAGLIILQGTGQNPPFIENLIRFDRPDIILVRDNTPVLVLEQTHEVPSGHNVGQRFGRLVNALEENVMTIFFVPFRGMKHGRYASTCYAPRRLVSAIERMWEIHDTPILAVNWPADANDELIRGGAETIQENGAFDVGLSELINDLITNDFDYGRCNTIDDLRRRMLQLKDGLDPKTDTLEQVGSVEIIPTAEYLQRVRQNLPQMINDIPDTFQARENTLVYTVGMTEENCNRTDPYTGQQFIYDYQFCRNGRTVNEKHTNLVLYFPRISIARWQETNPNVPERKSRLWYMTADLLEFTDHIIVARP